MMRLGLIALFVFCCWPLFPAECGGPRVASGNFSADIAGQPDSRPGTWGTAGAELWAIEFHPPEGCAIEIHSISGDIVSWVRWSNSASWAPAKDKFGVLYGFQFHRENRGGGEICDLCDVGTILYGQAGANSRDVSSRVFRQSYRSPVRLPEDRLWVKAAAWLNDTDQPVHLEITWTIEFQFVEVPQ